MIKNCYIKHQTQVLWNQCCFYSSKVNEKLIWTEKKLSKCLNDQLVNEKWWKGGYGKHPGRLHLPPISLPKQLCDSITCFLSDFDLDEIKPIGIKLDKFLYSRKPQFHQEVNMKRRNDKPDHIDADIKCNYKEILKLQNNLQLQKVVTNQPDSVDLQTINHWKAVEYDENVSAAYLLMRAATNYSSSYRVLNEIFMRDPSFRPTSLLDFGSGIGTNVWVSNHFWNSSLNQYICVDRSSAMNNLSFYLFSGGDLNMYLPGLYIRKSLPIASESTYDLVTASYSLSEIQSWEQRIKLLKFLWQKTDRYLVLIENGNIFGHQLIQEARSLLAKNEFGFGDNARRIKKRVKVGAVVAPCPHKLQCPLVDTKTSCTFIQKYNSPNFAGRFNDSQKCVFTYLILDKLNDRSRDHIKTWPRLLSPPKKLKNCISCKLCTVSGQLVDTTLSKYKDDKQSYTLLKRSKVGDLLPLTDK